MSNYFPDGRPIQKMMHALSDNALMVVISPDNLMGNVLQKLKEDFIAHPSTYPGYTEASFNEVLNKANIMQISSESGWFNLSNNTNRVFVPSSTAGGMYIHGTETIRKVYVEGCQVILYIKPTP